MKKLINPFKGLVLLAFAVTPLLSSASDGDNIEKKRSISKTYTVTADDRLSIENSFGNITVTTWDKNEIQVDIEIGVRASTEEKAQRMMDQINVSDNQGGKNIQFKTEIGNMGKGNKDNGNEDGRKFYVDYKISMPSKNPLNIENSFGKIKIPDFGGPTSLTSKFGELTTGNIPYAKLIQVEFGEAQIGKLNNADVIFKFNSKKSSVAGLNGNSKVDVQFCGDVDLTIDDTFTDLALVQSYSSINLRVTDKLSARFDVYTNFGSFENRTDFKIEAAEEEDNSGPKFDKNYSGSAGSGSAKIKIKSSFGSVRLINVNDTSTEKNDNKDNEKTKVDM
jgi:citrate lyase gamma subunit